jgi:signal transduction histidine kinase
VPAIPTPDVPQHSDTLIPTVPLQLAERVSVEPETKGIDLATVELQRKYNELHAIYRMAETVSRAGALDEIYSVALDELQKTVGADRSSVLLFDPDNVMRFKAWRGLSEEYRKAVEGHSPWKPDDTSAQPILVPDVKLDPNLAGYQEIFEAEGIAALGFIPLIDAGKLLGKFMIYFKTPHVVLGSEIQLAQSIASHIAFAISRKKSETDLREAEHAQRTLAEAAQEANHAKSQFLATMSHELRTPLNAIGGYAELLEMELHGTLTEEQRQDVTRIQKSQKHLLGLITDLLNFAKIETGHIELKDEIVSLEDAIVGVEVIVAPAIAAKKLRYRRERSAASISCRGDRDKIGQVLLNLASNAVKFAPEGSEVTIEWSVTPVRILVDVIDNGPGIPREKQELIFQPFVQLKDHHRVSEGTGLGLAISRELARAMGGDVTVKSEPPHGSKFTLDLKLA